MLGAVQQRRLTPPPPPPEGDWEAAAAVGGGGGVAVKKGSRVRIFGMQHGEEDLNGNTGTVETINDDGVANVRMHQEGGRVEVFAMENLTPLPKLPTHTSFRSRRK